MEKVSYSQSGAFPGVSQFIPNYSTFIPKALYPRKADVLKNIVDHLSIFMEKKDKRNKNGLTVYIYFGLILRMWITQNS